MIDKHGARTYLSSMNQRIRTIIVLLTGLCLLGGLAGPAFGGAVQLTNAGREGQTIDLKSLPVKGKTTVVDVFSQYCPPCMAIAPLMEKLAQKRSDLAIRKVSIQRPEVSGHIDWQSPLAKQLELRSIPHFMIFDQNGRLSATGVEARNQVVDWLKEAGLIK